MKVIVECPAGHRFRCDADHLGRKVRCPSRGCRIRFQLTPVSEADAPPSQPHDTRCPACGTSLSPDAALCVSCGIAIATGRQITTEVEDEQATAQRMLARGIDIDRYKPPRYGKGISIMIGNFALSAVAACLALFTHPEFSPKWYVRGWRRLFAEHWEICWAVVALLCFGTAIYGLVKLIRTGTTGLEELAAEAEE